MVLVTRLQQYQQRGIAPSEADWQLALSRTVLVDTTAAVRLAREMLSGECQSLMRFLLEKETFLPEAITRPGVWMAAALTKEPTTARQQYDQWDWPQLSAGYAGQELFWQVTVTNHYYNRYDYTLRKYQQEPYQQKTLTLDAAESQKTNKLQQMISKLLAPLAASELVIYQNIDLKAPYLSAEHNDVARYFSLVPNHLDSLLTLVIRRSLANGQEEMSPALLVATLQALLNWSGAFGEAAHLLIAASILNNNKTAQALAAECWIKGVDEETVDSKQIGTIIGKLESLELAPLKRFTDLLAGQLLRVSPRHDRALAQLLTACLPELSEKPIRGLRKLLEIYQEVAHHNESDLSNAEVQNKLETWQSIASLRKVASALTVEELVCTS